MAARIVASQLRPLLTRPTWTRSHRYVQFSTQPPRTTLRLRPTPVVGLFVGGIVSATLLASATIHADLNEEPEILPKPATPQPVPLSQLIRSYFVYSLCAIPPLVDNAPNILSFLGSIPIIRSVSEVAVRYTFFAQFVGGDTAKDTLPLLRRLRQESKGVLLAYSVEVDEAQASGKSTNHNKMHQGYKAKVQEMLNSIDFAGDFEDLNARSTAKGDIGRKSWVALKLTALVPSATSLERLSAHIQTTRPPSSIATPYPGVPHFTDLSILEVDTPVPTSPLTEEDILALRVLLTDLRGICSKATERRVKVIIDAEHSWYQPAIDAFTLQLSREFNRPSAASVPSVQPLVYGTYQAYLRRTVHQLNQSIAEAQREGYSLGVKLVRGAYHSQELSRYHARRSTTTPNSTPDSPPVWSQKSDTDNCYNECAALIISAIGKDIRKPERQDPTVGVLFGTHNWRSCELIIDSLVKEGLAMTREDHVAVGQDVADRVAFGQLLGMSNALTNHIAQVLRAPSPIVLKYVPYGALKEVMPYLSRRAIENKSVLNGTGGASVERQQAGAEIWLRLFGQH